MYLHIDDAKLLDILPVYDDRYIKSKIRTYGDKVYTNFCGLSVAKDGVEFKSFTVIISQSQTPYLLSVRKDIILNQ